MKGKTNSIILGSKTADATVEPNDLLYGETAYGADGEIVTGIGANWQYVKSLYQTFKDAGLVGEVTIYSPNASLGQYSFCRNPDMTVLNLTYAFISGGSYDLFSSCTSLKTINAELDMSSQNGSSRIFSYCYALEDVRFTPNSLLRAWGMSQSPNLSTATLLSIANGLNSEFVPQTLTLASKSKTEMNDIMVNNDAGFARIGTAMTLTAFITSVKGWTIA